MQTTKVIIDGQECATVIHNATKPPDHTQFITRPSDTQQVGYICYSKGGKVQPHYHLPIERHFCGTTEVVLVLSGKCRVTFYDKQQKQHSSLQLHVGDAIIIGDCGHGFEMEEDTVLFEVKQGPYIGLAEKRRFGE
jgi:cupin fold WbuC family metalloprotein